MKLNDPELVRGEVPIQALLNASMPELPLQAKPAPPVDYFWRLIDFKSADPAVQEKVSLLLNTYISVHRALEEFFSEQDALEQAALKKQHEAVKQRIRGILREKEEIKNQADWLRMSGVVEWENQIIVARSELQNAERERFGLGRYAEAAEVKSAEAKIARAQKKLEKAKLGHAEVVKAHQQLTTVDWPRVNRELEKAQIEEREIASRIHDADTQPQGNTSLGIQGSDGLNSSLGFVLLDREMEQYPRVFSREEIEKRRD